jgi:hypothetical protein
MHHYYLFGLDSFTDDAFSILKTAQGVNAELAKSWSVLWDELIFNINSSWWRGLIISAFNIALIGVLMFAFNEFKHAGEEGRQKILIQSVCLALIMGLILGGNGVILFNILRITKGFETKLVSGLAEVQIHDVKLKDALQNVSLSNSAKEKVDAALASCDNSVGDAYAACIKSKEAEIQAIVEEAEKNILTNNVAAKYARGVLDYIKDLGSDVASGDVLSAVGKISNTIVGNTPIFWILQIFLAAVQVAFSMALEIASLLHASALPFVIAFLFTPWATKFMESWISGWIQIVAIKFFYTSIIGIAAYALIYSEGQFTTALPFLFLVSIAGPTLALMLAKGGGAQLAGSLSNTTVGMATGAIKTAASAGAAYATGGGSMLGKNLVRQISRMGK